MHSDLVAILLFAVVCILIISIPTYFKRRKIRQLMGNTIEMSPSEFLKIRKAKSYNSRSSITKVYEASGVYVLYNKTKNKYYVGQGKQVMNRVNAHFTGHGNGDVYADWKYGDEFTIRIIRLEDSGYSSLNALERDTIASYSAYYKGYNKTRGNR